MLGDRDYMRGGDGSRPSWMEWSAVKTMLIINVVVFILCNMSHGRLTDVLSLNMEAIYKGQIWRLFTYMFTQQDFSHIFFNMWSLIVFGKLVEGILGKVRFLQLYVFSGLIGGVLFLLCNWVSLEEYKQMQLQLQELMSVYPEYKLKVPLVSCIGASGSTFGIMMAAAMAFPHAQMQLLFPPIAMKMRTMVAVFLVIELVEHFMRVDNVAHMAHLGGALGALIYMNRLMPQLRLRPRGSSWWSRLFKREAQATSDASKSYDRSDYRSGEPKRESRLGDLDPNEVDRILDKLSTTGRSSLTPREEEILQEASRRLRDGR